MNIIRLNHLEKTYGKGEAQVHALRGVSLTVRHNEMIAIMGASGSGKSTLLNIVGHLDRPTAGEYYLYDQLTNGLGERETAGLRNQKFGFVVQEFALIDRYTVYKNVLIPLTYSPRPIRSQRHRVEDVLSQLGILDKMNTLAANLSGGQRQRVAIARAIVNDPDIILADEPTGALDSKTGGAVIDIFSELHRMGKTIIMVTHNEEVAARCERVVTIEDGMIATR